MYTFIIKENGLGLDMVITRALLVLAAIAAMVYRIDQYYLLKLLSSVALFLAAVFIRSLLVKFKVNRIVLLFGAAIALFITTHSVAVVIIFLINGYLIKFLYKKPSIEVNDNGIIIKKFFAGLPYQWDQFSNIVLKDSLLTLDFKNNKLIQVSIEENKSAVDENAFNDYCKSFILAIAIT